MRRTSNKILKLIILLPWILLHIPQILLEYITKEIEFDVMYVDTLYSPERISKALTIYGLICFIIGLVLGVGLTILIF